jgi:hypothetical protein
MLNIRVNGMNCLKNYPLVEQTDSNQTRYHQQNPFLSSHA